MTDRQFLIRLARVYLAEARRRRGQRFGWTLLAWAARARREAALCPRREPEQMVLL